jgi:ABC-type Fe3+/spermidine/putrescine transport system ATPase subunit
VLSSRIAPSVRVEVFLFDEPLSNLDAKLRVQTRTEIKALHHFEIHPEGIDTLVEVVEPTGSETQLRLRAADMSLSYVTTSVFA